MLKFKKKSMIERKKYDLKKEEERAVGLQHLHHLLPFKQRFVVFKCRAEHTWKQKIFSQEQADNTINVWLLVKSQYLVYVAVLETHHHSYITQKNMVKHRQK